MSDKSYDFLVIGAGPGGYVCAIRAAQLGFKTAVIEKNEHLGGTCLNVGCIPSKALLHSTELYHEVHKDGAKHGINTGKLSADVAALMKNKEGVVKQLRTGIGQLLKARKIDVIHGTASFNGPQEVLVTDHKGTETISATNIVIASGSVPVELKHLPFDGEHVISSDQGIALTEIPKKMVVVGGGAIGLELGSVWARLGSEVTIVEFLPNIAPGCDPDVSKILERSLKKQKLKIQTNTAVTGFEKNGNGLKVSAKKGDKELSFEADKLLVSVGRRAYAEGLGLDKAGVDLDDRGRIVVNEHFQTKASGIYAIGDVIAGPMLAHKAEDEGVAVAEIIAGKAGHVNYDCIPNVIYTSPEVASVGINETQAKEKGIEVNVGKFPVAANGRAIASNATDGIAKVVACKKTDKLLGVQVVGHNASEIIAAAVTHMEYGGSAEDMARTVTAHPTVSEVLKEAALAVDGRAIHSL